MRLWLLSIAASRSSLADLVADALLDRFGDARKARRHLHHGFLVGAQDAVEGERVGQRDAPGFCQRHACGCELDVGDADPVGAVLVLLDMVVRLLRLLVRGVLGVLHPGRA
ncbi:hypothetical protein ACVWZW_001344 [Bradyrhizobium sp. F1.13.4]